MKIKDWLKKATKKLESENIPTARLDSLLILAFVLNKPKSWILANPDYDLSQPETEDINKLLLRRQKREPIAYLTHIKEFYGYDFYVNKHVMIPRPETEAMIDFIIKNAPKNILLAEVGTGSGAIALTISKERTDISVTATDISKEALKVARKNQANLEVDGVDFKHSDLLESVNNEYGWLVANLPYVPKDAEITEEARYEPKLALFAEENGIGIYSRLFNQLQSSNNFTTVVIEAEPFQRELLTRSARKCGYELKRHDDRFLYVFERS